MRGKCPPNAFYGTCYCNECVNSPEYHQGCEPITYISNEEAKLHKVLWMITEHAT